MHRGWTHTPAITITLCSSPLSSPSPSFYLPLHHHHPPLIRPPVLLSIRGMYFSLARLFYFKNSNKLYYRWQTKLPFFISERLKSISLLQSIQVNVFEAYEMPLRTRYPIVLLGPVPTNFNYRKSTFCIIIVWSHPEETKISPHKPIR